jgi:hypothetical protein
LFVLSHYCRRNWLAWWNFGQIKEFELSDSGWDREIINWLELRVHLVSQRCYYLTELSLWYEKSALFQEESILFCYFACKDIPALGSSREEVETFADGCHLNWQYLMRGRPMCHWTLIKTRDRKGFWAGSKTHSDL